jgi:hypothetical protein
MLARSAFARAPTLADIPSVSLMVSHRSSKYAGWIQALSFAWACLAGSSSIATAQSAAAGWENLFDGQTLAGWAQSGFEAEGPVRVQNPFKDGRGAIVIEKGTTLSGITWRRGGSLPRTNYEISLEAMKLEGSDFFCGLTFPVGKSACSFIVGGWSGMVVGISSIDYADASENETTTGMDFVANRWYRIRVRVTEKTIEAWIDDRQVVDVTTAGKKISMRPGDIQQSLPLGIATYMTSAAVRDIRLRRL